MFTEKYIVPLHEAITSLSDNESLNTLISVIKQLPEESRFILRRLLILLGKINVHTDITKMTAESLAKIFAPTLFSISSLDFAMDLKNTQFASDICTYMIFQYQTICSSLSDPPEIFSFRIFGNPPRYSLKEKTLFNLHSSSVTYAKDHLIKPENEPVHYIYTFVFLLMMEV